MLTKEQVNKAKFKYETWEPYMDQQEAAGRLTKDQLPPSSESQQIELRDLFKKYFKERLEQRYRVLYAKCFITEPAFKRMMSSARYNITRCNIAKFCIGIGATVEEAEEMLKLQGHRMDIENCRLDAILEDSLKDRIDIDEYYRRCTEEYDFDPDARS